jgi:hypothetical protein
LTAGLRRTSAPAPPGSKRTSRRRLAASAVAHRRNRCSAPAPASCSITRALAYPWEGGFVSLARAAGVERIEPGCAPQLSAACFAPTGDAGVLDLLAIAA